jgi:hypothetical protein
MPAVAPVHEHVHQRARQEEKPSQIGDGGGDMGAVLGHQEISGDDEEADQSDICAGGKKSALFPVTVVRHGLLLSVAGPLSHEIWRSDIPVFTVRETT